MDRSFPTWCVGVLVVSSLLSCFGGSGGGGGGGAATSGGVVCVQLATKLRGCGILSSGYFNCSEPADDRDRCQADCFLNADCSELELFACADFGSGPLDTLLQAPQFASCINACDGGDFACPSGETIPGSWICDGDNDCGDFSDEQDCASLFQCDDGQTVPDSWICDGFPDCTNAQDEADCPTFACGDGTTIPASFRCDDGPDCIDGSDELGCAEPLCGGEPRAVDPPNFEPRSGGTPGTCTDGTKSMDPCPQTGTSCSQVGGVAVACCIGGQFEQQLDPMSGLMTTKCQCEQASAGVIVQCGGTAF